MIDRLKKTIDKALDKYLPSSAESPAVIHRAMRYSVFSGGKRLRPILAVEAAKACGGGTPDALSLGCAIEMVHTFSLIHDDLPSMDDDDYRRGKKACHKVFGEANAILAGDALIILAFNVISRISDPKISALTAKELSLAIGTKGMVGGQVLDLGRKNINSKKNKNFLNHVNLLKTAKLFEVSVKLGAIAAGSGRQKIKAMAGYGRSLGMAFQMIDDLTDKESYATKSNIEKAKINAGNLLKRAKKNLSIFGKRADTLKTIADRLRRKIED